MSEIDKKDLEELRSAYLELFEKVDKLQTEFKDHRHMEGIAQHLHPSQELSEAVNKLIASNNSLAADHLILEQRFNEHVDPDFILPRFKEENLKALEDDVYRKRFIEHLYPNDYYCKNDSETLPDIKVYEPLQNIMAEHNTNKKQAEVELAHQLTWLLDNPGVYGYPALRAAFEKWKEVK